MNRNKIIKFDWQTYIPRRRKIYLICLHIHHFRLATKEQILTKCSWRMETFVTILKKIPTATTYTVLGLSNRF